MDKEGYMAVVCDQYDYLENAKELIAKDVDYTIDLIALNNKHSRGTSEIKRDLEKKKLKQDIIVAMYNNFTEKLKYLEIDIVKLRKELEE